MDRAEYSKTPLVVVPKNNSAVRLCKDFIFSLNSWLNVQQYPIPTVAEVLSTAAGWKKFSKLNLADAYLQVELNDESQKYAVLTTHKGFFRVNRLAFGLFAAQAIFKSIIEHIVSAFRRSQPYIDDVMVTGSTQNEHLLYLRKCFERLRAVALWLKRESVASSRSKSSNSDTSSEPTEFVRVLRKPKQFSRLRLREILSRWNSGFVQHNITRNTLQIFLRLLVRLTSCEKRRRVQLVNGSSVGLRSVKNRYL